MSRGTRCILPRTGPNGRGGGRVKIWPEKNLDIPSTHCAAKFQVVQHLPHPTRPPPDAMPFLPHRLRYRTYGARNRRAGLYGQRWGGCPLPEKGGAKRGRSGGAREGPRHRRLLGRPSRGACGGGYRHCPGVRRDDPARATVDGRAISVACRLRRHCRGRRRRLASATVTGCHGVRRQSSRPQNLLRGFAERG